MVGYDGLQGGAFHLDGGSLSVNESRVDESGGYISVLTASGDLTFDSVLWENNTSDHLWYIGQSGDFVATRNEVRGGSFVTVAYVTGKDMTMTNNVFSDIELRDDGQPAVALPEEYGGDQEVHNSVFYAITSGNPDYASLVNSQANFENDIVSGCSPRRFIALRSDYSLFHDSGVDHAAYSVGEDNL